MGLDGLVASGLDGAHLHFATPFLPTRLRIFMLRFEEGDTIGIVIDVHCSAGYCVRNDKTVFKVEFQSPEASMGMQFVLHLCEGDQVVVMGDRAGPLPLLLPDLQLVSRQSDTCLLNGCLAVTILGSTSSAYTQLMVGFHTRIANCCSLPAPSLSMQGRHPAGGYGSVGPSAPGAALLRNMQPP